MVLKYLLILLFTFALFNTYGLHNEDTFPEHIKTSKTKKHTRIKGTKVFGVFPKEYLCIEQLCRYQKSDDLYIQISESTAGSFFMAKRNFTREAIEAQGATIDILENITLNEFEGIYGEGPSKYPGETKLMLMFGDDKFIVIIFGICKTSDVEGKKQLQEIFKSIYYDRTLVVDPLELAEFEFDTSITGFKFASKAGNMFIYTEDGKMDSLDLSGSIMTISMMPQMSDSKAEMYLNDVMWRYDHSKIKPENKKIIKNIIGEYSAFIWETKIVYDETQQGISYVVVLVGKEKSLVFVGNAYKDIDDFLIKYKRTVESIKIL